MTQRSSVLLCLSCGLSLSAACSNKGQSAIEISDGGPTTGADAGPTVGAIVSFTPSPDVDPSTLPFPRTDAGALILSGTSHAQLVWTLSAPGPITAAAQCSRWVTSCVSPDRSLDDCARSVPTCETDQPWNESACCPAACFQRYVAARLAGTKDLDAFMTAYLSRSDPCVPGLKALLGIRP
jgi:hypothetical protein